MVALSLLLVGAIGLTWVFRDALIGAFARARARALVEEHLGGELDYEQLEFDAQRILLRRVHLVDTLELGPIRSVDAESIVVDHWGLQEVQGIHLVKPVIKVQHDWPGPNERPAKQRTETVFIPALPPIHVSHATIHWHIHDPEDTATKAPLLAATLRGVSGSLEPPDAPGDVLLAGEMRAPLLHLAVRSPTDLFPPIHRTWRDGRCRVELRPRQVLVHQPAVAGLDGAADRIDGSVQVDFPQKLGDPYTATITGARISSDPADSGEFGVVVRAWVRDAQGRVVPDDVRPSTELDVHCRNVSLAPVLEALGVPGVTARADIASDAPLAGALLRDAMLQSRNIADDLLLGFEGAGTVQLRDVQFFGVRLDRVAVAVDRPAAGRAAVIRIDGANPGSDRSTAIQTSITLGNNGRWSTPEGALTADLDDLAVLGLPVNGQDVSGHATLTGQAEGWLDPRQKPDSAPWVRVSGVLSADSGQVAGVPVHYLHTRFVELTDTRFTAERVQAGRTLADGTTEAVETPKLVLDWDDRFTCTTQIGLQLQDTWYYANTLGNLDPPFRAKVRTTEDIHRVELHWGPPEGDPSAPSRFTVNVPKLDVQQVRVGGRPVGEGGFAGLTVVGDRITNFALELNGSEDPNGRSGHLKIRGNAGVEGPEEARRFVATVTTLGLQSPQGFTAALPEGESATLTIAERRLQISQVRLEGKGANLLLQQGGFDETGKLDVTAEVSGTELQLFTSWVGLADVTGRIQSGKIEIRGTLDVPLAHADFTATGVTAGPITNADLVLDAETDGDRLAIRKAHLRAPQEGTFEVTGNLPPLQSLESGARLITQCLSDSEFRLYVKGTGVDLGRLLNGAGLTDGAVATAPSLLLNLTPAKGGPEGTAELTVANGRLFGRPMAAVVKLSLKQDGLHIEPETNLRIDGGSAFARGTIPRPASAELDDWLQVAERLDAELAFAGVELKHLPFRNDAGEPLFSDGRSAGRIAVTGTLAAPILRGGLELDDARVAQLQRLDARLEFHTQRNGRTELLRISEGWLRGLGIDTELHGTVPVALGLEAVHPAPAGVAINPVVPNTPPTTLRLRPWSDTDARGTVIAQLHDAQLRLFTEDVSGIEKLRGLVRGALNITLRWGAERNGTIPLTYAVDAELEAQGVTYPGIRHGQLKFEGRVTERGVEQARVELDTDKGLVVAQGGLKLDTPGDWAAMLDEGAAQVEARIVSPSVDLSVLQPALEPHLRAAGGAIRFPNGIIIRGPMQSPQMDGTVELAGIQFASGQSGLPEISKLRGVLRFAGNRVLIGAQERIQLRLGGGNAQLWGAVTLRDWSWRTLDVQLRATQSRILTSRDLSLVADLRGHPSRGNADSGGVRLEGRYDAGRGTVRATLRGAIVVDGGRYTQDYRTRRSTGAGALDIGLQVPGVEQLEYDLVVRTRRPLEIRNNIAATRVHVGTRLKPLRIFGDSRNPLLDGTINAKSGTAQLPIQVGDATLTRYKMTVRDVIIAFDPDHARDPLISGQLFFRYRQYEIQVVIPQGRLSLINTDSIRFSAQPPDLTQEQIRAILLVGVPSVSSAEDAQNLVLVAATMAGLDLLVQTLFPGERGVVGEFLDRLTIEAASGDRLSESTVRAEVRIFDWLNLYGAREGDDTYHGGLSLKMSLPRAKPPAGAAGTGSR